MKYRINAIQEFYHCRAHESRNGFSVLDLICINISNDCMDVEASGYIHSRHKFYGLQIKPPTHWAIGTFSSH